MGQTNLGRKIKYFRERAKMSQLELEVAVDASNGSISRMENGHVNPTKETLSKITQALQLKPAEIAELLGLNILTPEELVDAINKISKSLDLKTTLQTAVDIMFNLYPNYNGGVICLLNDKGELQGKTVSYIPRIDEVIKMIGRPISSIKLPSDRKDNLFIRTVEKDVIIESNVIQDFVKGVFPATFSEASGKILGFKSGITVPVHYKGKVIGAALFTKRTPDGFAKDKQVLQLLSDQIGIAIKKAEHIAKVNYQIRKLKSQLKQLEASNS